MCQRAFILRWAVERRNYSVFEFYKMKNDINYSNITDTFEKHILFLLAQPVYTKKQRQAFAYGSYLAWHALVGKDFSPEDDERLWKLVRYR